MIFQCLVFGIFFVFEISFLFVLSLFWVLVFLMFFLFFLGGGILCHDKILQNIPQFTLWVKAKQLDTVRMTISSIHRVCYRVPSTHRWKEPCKNWNEFWMHNSVLIVSSLLGSSKISKYPNPLNPFPLSWRLCQDMMELVCGISLLCKGSEDCWEFENVEGVRVITPFITSRSPPFILEHQKNWWERLWVERMSLNRQKHHPWFSSVAKEDW